MVSNKDIWQQRTSIGQAVDALRMVIDPELGINIIDMGLLYSVDIDEQEKRLHVGLTLSSRGCPMGRAIISGAENILQSYFPGYSLDVELVWEPTWQPQFISEEGKQQLE